MRNVAVSETRDESDTMNSDVNETPHECTDARCVETRRQRDELLAVVRDLSHSQLIGRDVELGLRAELVQARIDLIHADGRSAHVVDTLRRSTTWRIGRMVTLPLAMGKRVMRKARGA